MIISRGIPFSGLVVPATTRYRSVMELSRLGLPVKFNFSPVFYRTGKIYLDTVFLIVDRSGSDSSRDAEAQRMGGIT